MELRKNIITKHRSQSALDYSPNQKINKKSYFYSPIKPIRKEKQQKILKSSKDNLNRIFSSNNNSTNYTRPLTSFTNIFKTGDKSYSNNYSNYEEYTPFLIGINSKNIININDRLIKDLNSQINSYNEKKTKTKFNYKQSVNLMKLNDYILYEYTKNKIYINKEKKQKSAITFRMPLSYRRIASHNKKEDLIPINNQPKINLEDVLILHNRNVRVSMAKKKVKNYFFKSNLKYKKSKPIRYCDENNKYFSDEIAYKYINIM